MSFLLYYYNCPIGVILRWLIINTAKVIVILLKPARASDHSPPLVSLRTWVEGHAFPKAVCSQALPCSPTGPLPRLCFSVPLPLCSRHTGGYYLKSWEPFPEPQGFCTCHSHSLNSLLVHVCTSYLLICVLAQNHPHCECAVITYPA